VSTEIVDIMKAARLESPDISILSDEFLAEVRDIDKKNLAIEALKKLINGNVRAQSQRNVTQARAFSEPVEAANSRYHANAPHHGSGDPRPDPGRPRARRGNRARR